VDFFHNGSIRMKHLIIGPGSLGYFSLLGSMNRLFDDGVIKRDSLESISASSAGALLAVMALVHNFDFKKILKKSIEVNLKNVQVNFSNFVRSRGLVSKDQMIYMIHTCVPDYTLRELYDMTHIHLYITIYDTTYHRCIYMSHETHPNMSIVRALYMSITIPLIFEPIETYIDGAMHEEIPGSFCLLHPDDDVGVLQLKFDKKPVTNTLLSYLYEVFNSWFYLRKSYKFKHTWKVPMVSNSILSYKCPDTYKIELYSNGYNNLEKSPYY